MSENEIPSPTDIHQEITASTIESSWSFSVTGFYRGEEAQFRISGPLESPDNNDLHLSIFTADGDMAATMFLSEGVLDLLMLAEQAADACQSINTRLYGEDDDDDDDDNLIDDDDDDDHDGDDEDNGEDEDEDEDEDEGDEDENDADENEASD